MTSRFVVLPTFALLGCTAAAPSPGPMGPALEYETPRSYDAGSDIDELGASVARGSAFASGGAPSLPADTGP